MTTTKHQLINNMIYWGGISGIVGGFAVGLAYVLHPHSATPDVVASSFWIAIHALFMISLLGGIFLLIMLSVQYLNNGGGVQGIAGCALGIISMILIMALDYAEMFIFPVLAKEFPEVVLQYGDGVAMPSLSFVFPITGLLFLAGYGLFGYELMKTGTVDKKAALSLVCAVVVFVAGLSGFLPMMVIKVGAVLFGLSLIWVSISLMQIVKGNSPVAASTPPLTKVIV